MAKFWVKEEMGKAFYNMSILFQLLAKEGEDFFFLTESRFACMKLLFLISFC